MPPADVLSLRRRRAFAVIGALAVAAVVAFVAALVAGSVATPLNAAWQALAHGASGSDAVIVRELRLPRAIAAFATGGLLALAGTLMQALLRNPLADPYVLGISGGAAVAALGAMMLGFVTWVAPAAFAGAVASIVLVFGLASAGATGARWTSARLLLTGVVVAAGWGALIALLLTLSPDAQVKGMLFWLLGDLSAATFGTPALACLAVALAGAMLVARDLNLVARGGDLAQALGVSVETVTLAAHGLAALATAFAVATAGPIGFIGLVAPHALRLVIGNDQRLLLPAAALAGGTLLLVADTLARTIVAPMQLPVGVLTALLGVPAFLALLLSGSRH